MAYGLKYQTQFTSSSDANIPEKNYTLQFWFKNYAGQAVSVLGGETSVVQRCTQDDPFAPIKGQSLDISLINKGGSLPITAFQSNQDDDIMVKLLDENDNVLFTGFTVQDDFFEIMVDYDHPITLSANDGLGLLKGVILSEAEMSRRYSVVLVEYPALLDHFYISAGDASFVPKVGGTIEILGVVYTFQTVMFVNLIIGPQLYEWLVKVDINTPGWSTPITELVTLTGTLDLLAKNRLIDIIAACLKQTNLSLTTNIYHTLFEYLQDDTRSSFAQTLVDSQLFIQGETYKNCYDTLQIIMQTFNCSVFQANGQWNIVNWHEMRNYNNAILGYSYDETMTYLGRVLFSNTFFIGPAQQTRPIFSLTNGAMRGYNFTRKTFNYNQPKYLLRNNDLQIVGDLLRQYISGVNTVYEYVATSWTNSWPVGTAVERFIRVIKDAQGTELDRALVLRGPTGDSARAVEGIPFEVTTGDKLKFSFSFQTNKSQPGPATIIFAVRLTDGTLNRYIDELPAGNGTWGGAIGFNYLISSGDNTNNLHSVEISSSQVPFSGLVYCYLAQAIGSPGATDETWYRDIRLEYTPYINDSSKITGQIHKQVQPVDIKNNSDVEVVIDDSPRNSIVGTLFRNTKTGLLQDRTLYWRYPPDAAGWRLGERTTLQELLWRQATRSKLEGGFIGNYQSVIISLLTMAITDFNPTKNYTFGLLTIDYKANQFSGTLWEIYDSADPELNNTYTLTYIYNAK